MATTTVKVGGMTCGGCVASVTRVLKATPGVDDAVVRLDSASAMVTFDPARTSLPALKSAIVDAGYAVGA